MHYRNKIGAQCELIVISDICKNTHIVRNDMFCVLSEYHTGTIVQV